MPETAISFSGGAVDLRQGGVSAQINDSTAANFMAQLEDTAPADYAVIDLGAGREWLTSRLFIMAILLKRVRNIRAIVFVETAGEIRRRFVGTADPERIRWRLAMRYFWLEDAFRHAYGAPGMIQIRSGEGGLDPRLAVDIFQEYTRLIQQPAKLQGPFGSRIRPQAFDSEEGIPIDKTVRERAEWLDGAKLEDIMGSDLATAYVNRSDVQNKPEAVQLKVLLSETAPLIAVTRQDMRFEYLVERQKLLERVAENFLTASPV